MPKMSGLNMLSFFAGEENTLDVPSRSAFLHSLPRLISAHYANPKKD
jgi:hypothetical protein